MKIIDERGRLFGKINVIDFLAVLFFLFLLSLLYFGYKTFSKPKKSLVSISPLIVTSKLTSLDCYVVMDNLSPEIAKLISVGDKDIEGGKIVAEILEVSKPENDFYKITVGGDKIIFRQDPERKQLVAKMRLYGDIRDRSFFYYKTEKISIGSDILFATDKYKVNCRIETIEGGDLEGQIESEPKPALLSRLEPVELNITLMPLSPDEAKQVGVGDLFLDEAGNKLGEVLGLRSEPATYSYDVDLGAGNVITRQNPNRRQLLIKARLLGEVKNNAFYYKGERITVGSKVSLKTDKYSTEGQIESEPKPTPQQKVLLKVRFQELMPEIVNLIKIGDGEKDGKGTLISRVKSVVSNRPSEILVQEGGKIKIIDHPVNRNVVLLIEAICIKDGDKLFFNNYIMKINKSILLSTDKYDITGTLIEIGK